MLLVGACTHGQEYLWREVHVLLVDAYTHGQECLWCEVHVLLVGACTQCIHFTFCLDANSLHNKSLLENLWLHQTNCSIPCV